jgi:HEAT repeats
VEPTNEIAVAILRTYVKNPVIDVRRSAVAFLKFAHPVPEPLIGDLVDELNHPDPQIRAFALLALLQMDANPPLAKIRERLQDRDAHVRSAATEVLAALERKGIREPATDSKADR